MCEPVSQSVPLKTDSNDESNSVVVIGAGAAGLFAAKTAMSILNPEWESKECVVDKPQVIVLEAKYRYGGRVHTIDLPSPITQDSSIASASCDKFDSNLNEEITKNVQVDVGASWLQQFPDNFMARSAESLGLDLCPTDFQSALCSASDGMPIDDLHKIVDQLCEIVLNKVETTDTYSTILECGDMSIVDALKEHMSHLPVNKQREAHLALSGDINSDFGYFLHDTSAKHALLELGIGNEDHYIKQGYGAILKPVAEALDIRYNCAVKEIDWSHENYIAITTFDGQVFVASKCICTVPVSQLTGPGLSFIPKLPTRHSTALSRIKLGKCEKIVLRFQSRWWTHSSNGLYRWYDNEKKEHEFPMILNWNEWLDLTDFLGVPLVVGFCVGEEGYESYLARKDDKEIATAAAKAFESWAWYQKVRRRNEVIKDHHI